MRAILQAVGDIGPDRDDPRECFALARTTLRDADLAFCQLEVNLTERGVRMPQARHTGRAVAASASAIRDAGFDVVSFAGNHCMDWGPDGLFDTIGNLRGAGLDVVGVGADIAAARAPVVREVNGIRVAFVAYSSILPEGYWATETRAGCAPMRAHTHYEQIEPDQPGTPPRVHTWAHRGDLDALRRDVAAVKARTDVVIVSLHWGIHFVPAVLADYQREVAHAAIDAGASLILGHHAHILKGIELYRGKAIFYSLGNFAIDLRMTPAHAASQGFREIQALSPDWVPNFDSLYNFPPDSRMTGILRAVLTTSGVADLSFFPGYINDDAQPEVLRVEDPRFTRVRDYLEWCCRSQGLATKLQSNGDVIRIVTG
jgi:poly-gamma-glutamate capsule biosynthesis protein CapA/YwtB (metallophosphatase superfamily)